MRARTVPDDRVAEAARRRLEALVAELDGDPTRIRAGESARDAAADADLDADLGAGLEVADDTDLGEEHHLAGGGRHARRPVPAAGRAASWVGDRTPASLTGATLGARHLVVVSVLLVAGLSLAGWSYLRSTGGDQAGEVVAPRSSGGVPVGLPGEGSGEEPEAPGVPAEPPSGSAAVSPAAELVVDVEGKVRRPGIAVLPAGSRVVDALEAAGGARPGADLRDLNLARPLVDGEQLLVGIPSASGVAAGALSGPPTAAPSTTSGAGSGATAPVALVNLNTADQAALETLPGVGPVTAAAILQWRTDQGAFTSVDELLEVSGIGDATLAEIAPHVTL